MVDDESSGTAQGAEDKPTSADAIEANDPHKAEKLAKFGHEDDEPDEASE